MAAFSGPFHTANDLICCLDSPGASPTSNKTQKTTVTDCLRKSCSVHAGMGAKNRVAHLRAVKDELSLFHSLPSDFKVVAEVLDKEIEKAESHALLVRLRGDRI